MDIDVVVTWVDGSDPAHQAKRRAALTGRPAPDAVSETRFADRGEIATCLRSILRFAPFVRRIHVLTDAQRPAVLDRLDPERVVLVDHREAFAGYEAALPLFSGRGIETMLWRIPGLAERFVYLNDDMFLTRPAAPGDWFDHAGRPVLRGEMRAVWPVAAKMRLRQALARLPGRSEPRPGYRASQALAAERLGHRRFLYVDHHPHPLRRGTFADLFAARPDVLRENIAHRFRSARQVNPAALANQAEIAAGTPVVGPSPPVARIAHGAVSNGRALDDIAAGRVASACVQSLDRLDPDDVRALDEVTRTLLGA